MLTLVWFLVVAVLTAFGWLIWHNLGKLKARRLAEEARFAQFMADSARAPTAPATAAAPTVALPAAATALAPGITAPAATAATAATANNSLAQQKLLFDAAHKAGEAGEAALSIQLYARLLVRYPTTSFAGPARAAVEQQKRRLSKR